MNPKFCRMVLAGLLCGLGVSCTTAYDAYGYPRQVVEPGVAIAGAAAVGLLAYGLANRDDDDDQYYSRDYDRGHYHGGHDQGDDCQPSYYRPYHGGYDYHH